MRITSDGRFGLRNATHADLSALARLHRAAYSGDHFLARLSEEGLADYYARFLGDGSQIVVALPVSLESPATSPDSILGFAAFGRNIEARIAAFKRDRRGSILLAAMGSPMLAGRKVFSRLTAQTPSGPPHRPAAALLLSIAVRASGKGVGRVLLEDMFQCAAAAGEPCLGLYVRHQNVGAINAYLRVGFQIKESIHDQYYMEHALVHLATERTA